ncbi:Soluble epoxide hydrolase, putative [Coccidioides posadasii C735 delta SOWgp]|uniref:Soluble epoxide hydrolase, putative n=1 Tax=Coccidioides posadasii (strain C735) TaxID=222929 RepID=C5PB54_COCP7|nr:Soluble epoxide hydrolase, putative [Coccidioides posadasii C735 delta SOWgp]EER25838.1 Soluble epoxide hydrolase, putative [Coccidioides posadasii C735 delta SOWgp]|eukprot:XP_003067983.1 Soluble epoxide hydrolase, putative [Coccidioides posadasii C735 delta SOWgp]
MASQPFHILQSKSPSLITLRMPGGSCEAHLFTLHGLLSSSWDWRHMIVRLRNTGYGVIVPDLLGYGDTDKPVELNSYAMTQMTHHIVEILDIEDVGTCIGVAHDWYAPAVLQCYLC